jgi:cytochrome c peroxidase
VIARAPTNDALFIADEDHKVIRGVALPAEEKGARTETPLPGAPAQLLVLGKRVLVTIREAAGKGGLLIIFERKGALELEEKSRVPMPADAWGVAVTPNGNLAVVTSAWTHKVSGVDLTSAKVLWTVDVPREPRGVVITKTGDTAYLSHLTSNTVTRLDNLSSAAPKVTDIKLDAAPLRGAPTGKLEASLGYALTLSPDESRVYFPRHALAAQGGSAWFGSSAVDVMLTRNDTQLAPRRRAAPQSNFAPSLAATFPQARWMGGAVPVTEPPSQFPEPRDIVYRVKTNTLLVASEGDGKLVELDALATDPALAGRGVYTLIRRNAKYKEAPENGGAPAGLVLSQDESQAYVFCRSTYDLAVVELLPDDGRYRSLPPRILHLADDPSKDADVATGRRLFYSAGGSLSGGVACAGCHPEGRDDAHVWHEVSFKSEDPNVSKTPIFLASADLTAFEARWGDLGAKSGEVGYARQTPMIAGRVKAAGPYGWHGESADLAGRIIGGFHLHRWNGELDEDHLKGLAGYIAAFVRSGLVPPPVEERALTAEEERGKAIFESPKSECRKCHVGAEMTDRIPSALSVLPTTMGFEKDPNPAFKTPSLLGVGGSAPYMHDGRFESLESLIEGNGDRMGKTAYLSTDEKKALIAYLRTL